MVIALIITKLRDTQITFTDFSKSTLQSASKSVDVRSKNVCNHPGKKSMLGQKKNKLFLK